MTFRNEDPILQVVMYHYVRDLPNSRFPRIKGMLTDTFRDQVRQLAGESEMATLESALDFLRGSYRPKRNLCVLTFDDGLREHYSDVTQILSEHGIQGIFFVITRCQEENIVAPVHMNHFLMADLDWKFYREEFERELCIETRETPVTWSVDLAKAQRTYPWDIPDVAQFKYLFNFVLQPALRDRVVRTLFAQHMGDETSFARMLYFSWEEARQMQAAGMIIGGHSHEHSVLAQLGEAALEKDLHACRRLLDVRLNAQSVWPFSYPYGKRDSYTPEVVRKLEALDFDCAFATEAGLNPAGVDHFAIRRIDCNVAGQQLKQTA